MTMESRLNQVLQLPKRKLIVSLNDIALNKDSKVPENVVFVLMVEESPGSAGGRGGGSGNRKIDKITGFRVKDSKDVKIFETENPDIIEKFEIPYNAVAMDIVLESGEPFVAQGVVDDYLVQSYLKLIE